MLILELFSFAYRSDEYLLSEVRFSLTKSLLGNDLIISKYSTTVAKYWSVKSYKGLVFSAWSGSVSAHVTTTRQQRNSSLSGPCRDIRSTENLECVGQSVESCCSWGTGTVREPRGKVGYHTESVTRKLMKNSTVWEGIVYGIAICEACRTVRA
jgi:hypothetical protein